MNIQRCIDEVLSRLELGETVPVKKSCAEEIAEMLEEREILHTTTLDPTNENRVLFRLATE